MQAPGRHKGTLVALFAAAVGAGTLLPGRRSSALSCAFNASHLVLLEVSEDGVPLSDRSVYQRALTYVYGRAAGEVELIVHPGANDSAIWAETYRAVAGTR